MFLKYGKMAAIKILRNVIQEALAMTRKVGIS